MSLLQLLKGTNAYKTILSDKENRYINLLTKGKKKSKNKSKMSKHIGDSA
jgi:hypothetical protein